MASVDKIYGTDWKQYQELIEWVGEEVYITMR